MAAAWRSPRSETILAAAAVLSQGMTRTPFGAFFVRKAEKGEFGDGVTAQLLKANGIAVFGESEIETLLEQLDEAQEEAPSFF